MKYILTLSLSGICLAVFTMVLQGNALSAGIDFGALFNNETKSYARVMVAQADSKDEVVESKTVRKQKVVKPEKPQLTRNEAIKQAVKDRPWEEAKPEVVRILKDYSTKDKEVRRDERPQKRIEKNDYRDRKYKTQARDGITEGEAIAIALKDTPGEVIGAKWKKGKYRVKVWSEADRATYKIYINPQTGEVVKRKRK